jgi:hypothetical protein
VARSAFAFDVRGAGWDEGEWRNDASAYNAMKAALDEAWEKLPTRKKKKSKKENNAKDALIAARKNGIRVCYLKPSTTVGP